MSYEEFRRRIDTARNILVGAVPSPAGQIDQITYALMYKFMNDIDDKSAALPDGKRIYFIDDYEQYNWHRLMDLSLGAHDRLELYRRAIQNMAQNPNIPELFRSIYQNAFLPFNSSNVLTLFLKEMDKFSYGEGDDIGDAYEYLLSITGAQGDVGQFRTPRHIIKFIVEAVNPTKDDKVLDPACGTAGFLIAAYAHVRAKHDGKDEQGNPNDEQRLTADELDKIHHNYRGFDIDPTMVRTAKVNMYLHGFKTPDIINHDSLSTEEYWNDRYDVILANPPFMTPKGGIQPHKKFSISANRAEVLFVDYIAGHLKPGGRAGIIVPEGIIFQSGNAYKQLRKNLVEDSLYAVVSLPSGVFNPYAGVKTSILLLDREIAKQRDEILFVKVENDGYSLGAQRRPVSGNQLPEAREVIERFKGGNSLQADFAHAVSCHEIAESGDYNLNGDRYKAVTIGISSDYDRYVLEEVVDTISASVKIKTSDVLEGGTVPVVDQSQKYITGYTNNEAAKIADVPVVAFGDHTKSVKYVDFAFAQGADGIKILRPKDAARVVTKYLYYVMANLEMPDKGYSRHWTEVKRIQIPLPPIEIQREIVAELDGYQKIIDAAQTIVQTYRPNIKISAEWAQEELGKIAKLVRGPFGGSLKKEIFVSHGYKVYEQGDAIYGKLQEARYFIDAAKFTDMKRFQVAPNDIIMSCSGTIGRVKIIDEGAPQGVINQALLKITPNSNVLPSYLKTYFESGIFQQTLSVNSQGGVINNVVSVDQLSKLRVPLPALEVQKQIVGELEAEQALVAANKKLIEIYQQKIKDKIAEVWGE